MHPSLRTLIAKALAPLILLFWHKRIEISTTVNIIDHNPQVSDEIAIFRLELSQKEHQLLAMSKNVQKLTAENALLVGKIVKFKEDQAFDPLLTCV